MKQFHWLLCVSKNCDWSRKIAPLPNLTRAPFLVEWKLTAEADIAFIMSSSTSAWLLSPLECSPQKQNGWTLRFCFWGWIMWKMYNKTFIEFGFGMISWIIKTSCLCYLPQPSASADHSNTDLGFDKYRLFAGWEVRIVKTCDRGLENAARGRRPRAAFSRPRSQFFTIRTDLCR